ncbi:RAD9, HUS1, RAD1-interacting nuclear orphan protein 1 [Tachyglossus aculeatus]|uniref:RAD9, HUS1, RAD1-interacting nuclear orphan protein 1 n=1 Tax=Tachyglossus aculeatus TaxID=9261 RepID=UPI0018F4CE9D|nr:RAD9, HUS1, RAD1-interacting nuclear orphan protein 1 [Tachyglossus aculeatus]XP_038623882.1 RAD9, HUS1, RAD1-interacting nuclear orphan protein 1 [Tachyglossus aculeatus]
MPPGKKSRRPLPRAQLLFREEPLEGPKHPYGSPQPTDTRPRPVPTKPIDHNTATSWVISQFEGSTGGRRPARQRPHRDPMGNSSRKPQVCKFLPLAFSSLQAPCREPAPTSPPAVKRTGRASQSPMQARGQAGHQPLVPMLSPPSCGHLSGSELASPGFVFLPPDIQTPEMPSGRGSKPPEPSPRPFGGLLSHSSPPEDSSPGPTLVLDTPEESYGLKVTWRKRRHLLAYLRQRGKLSQSQFLLQAAGGESGGTEGHWMGALDPPQNGHSAPPQDHVPCREHLLLKEKAETPSLLGVTLPPATGPSNPQGSLMCLAQTQGGSLKSVMGRRGESRRLLLACPPGGELSSSPEDGEMDL